MNYCVTQNCKRFNRLAGEHCSAIDLNDMMLVKCPHVGTNEYDERIKSLTTKLEEAKGEIASMRERKRVAYHERNEMVLFLSRIFESHLCRHVGEEWEDDWRWIVCVHGPKGQMTWHIHDSEYDKFKHLPEREGHWDGHNTDEKYDRLRSIEFTTQLSTANTEIERLKAGLDFCAVHSTRIRRQSKNMMNIEMARIHKMASGTLATNALKNETKPAEDPEPILGRDKAMKEQAEVDELARNITDTFHMKCTCPNNGGGDCDWCNDYNALRGAFSDLDPAVCDLLDALTDNVMEKRFNAAEEKKLEG